MFLPQLVEVVKVEQELANRFYYKERPLSMDNNNAVQVQKSPVSFFNREPVAIVAALRAALALAIGFGFSLSPEQMALVITFAEVLLALFTRQQVTPFVATGTTPNVDEAKNTPMVDPQVNVGDKV